MIDTYKAFPVCWKVTVEYAAPNGFIVAEVDDGHIFSVPADCPAPGNGANIVNSPAGKLDDPKEPKIECASRELEEETGYRCGKLEYLLSINTTIAFCDEALDVFLARDLVPSAQHLDPEEEISVEEWELPDLLELIYSGKMTDGKTVAAVMAYACKYSGLLQA